MTSRRSIVLNAALLLAALSCIEPTAARNPPLPSKTDASQFALAFERNQGQFDAPVRFLSRGPGYTLFLTDDEAVWRVLGASGDQVLRMQLIDGKATHARGERPLKPRHHYLDLRSGTARARHVETYAATRMVSVRQRPFFPAGFCFGSLIGFPLAVVSHIGSPFARLPDLVHAGMRCLAHSPEFAGVLPLPRLVVLDFPRVAPAALA